ncbi:GNAT family N-acetyltransferase [Janthinobacterium sp. B9-8]|uniref:GNAT family N-acetyltransferase n=1 Tax=Janthinobacterium sp. B9-8 TaxID=1236179 RepID=UPI00061CDD9D|nr:GNAT family N-acetyltransferase [Janthinobacterium sp. B9-8]
MHIHIQQTTDVDWLDLKTIRLFSLAESPDAFGLTHEVAFAYTDAQWQDRAGNRTPPMYFVARDEGNPVGLIGGVKANTGFNLIAMWVAPSHRGLGIGSVLVEKVLAAAVPRGESEVCLFVSPLNKAACALYERMGFCFTPHFEALESDPKIMLQRMLARFDTCLPADFILTS